MENKFFDRMGAASAGWLVWTVAFLTWATAAGAQRPVVAPKATAPMVSSASLSGLIDVQADDLSYDASRRLVIARGNVKVTRGTDSVSADYAEVDTAAEQVSARGNILISYMGNTWKGNEATYNFRTGQGRRAYAAEMAQN